MPADEQKNKNDSDAELKKYIEQRLEKEQVFYGEKYNEMIANFSAFDKAFKKSKQELTELTAQINKIMSVQIDLISSKKVEALENRVEDLESDHNKKMKEVINKIDRILSERNNFSKNIKKLSQNDGDLNTQLDNIRKELGELKKLMKGFCGRLDSVEANQDTLAKNDNILEGEVEAIKKEIASSKNMPSVHNKGLNDEIERIKQELALLKNTMTVHHNVQAKPKAPKHYKSTNRKDKKNLKDIDKVALINVTIVLLLVLGVIWNELSPEEKISSYVTTTTTMPTHPTASTKYSVLSDDSGDEPIWYVAYDQDKKVLLPDALQKISGFRDNKPFTFDELREELLETMKGDGNIFLTEADVKSLTEFSLKEGKLFTEESLEPFIKTGFMTVEKFFILVLIIAEIFIATVLYKIINSDTTSTTVKRLFILIFIIFIAVLSWGLAAILDKPSPGDKASSSVTTTTLPAASANYSFLSDDSGDEPIWYVAYDQDKKVLLPGDLQKISGLRDKKRFTFYELRNELLDTMRQGDISLSEADVKSLTEFSLKEGKLFTEESLEPFIKTGTGTDSAPDSTGSELDMPITDSLKKLLAKMGKTEQRFKDEIKCLENELTTSMKTHADGIPKGELIISMYLYCASDKDEITIRVADWMRQEYLPIKRICKLWLQIQVEAATLDGATGSGTKKKFLEKFPDSNDIYVKLIGTDWNTD